MAGEEEEEEVQRLLRGAQPMFPEKLSARVTIDTAAAGRFSQQAAASRPAGVRKPLCHGS